MGEYVIKLTVTSSTGERVATTTTVKVGKRWALGFLITNATLVNGQNEPWDEDESGRDLLFGFGKRSDDQLDIINMGPDYLPEHFPAGGFIPIFLQKFFSDEEWVFELKGIRAT